MNVAVSMRFLSLMTLLLLTRSFAAGPAAQSMNIQTLNNGQLILHDIPPIPDSLVNRLNQYQSVRSANFLDWTEDGAGMYIMTRFGFIDQIHRVFFPGALRQQLTFVEEPIGEVVRQPQGSLLALTMDRGGSEFSQVYLFDPASAMMRMVSDGSSRNSRLVWDTNGSRLAYQSTRRNGRSKDIWLMDVRDTAAAKVILEAPADS